MIYTSCSNELHPLWVALFHYLLDGFHYLLDAFHYLENPTPTGMFEPKKLCSKI